MQSLIEQFRDIYENADEIDEVKTFEWATLDNPYFPSAEIDKLKARLDPQSFQAMFEINWDITPKSAVYSDYDIGNQVKGYVYNPQFETYVCIDWGWTHPMSVGFYQYDKRNDMVYLFDEIVRSKLRIDDLYKLIAQKPYMKTERRTNYEGDPYDHITNLTAWVCDIAGDQEREQTGKANCRVYKEKFGVTFKRRRSRILYGIAIVRSYILNAQDKRRFFVDVTRCPKHNDGFKRYAYPEKDGKIINENPIKQDDDEVDETRYFFVNILDKNMKRHGAGITMR